MRSVLSGKLADSELVLVDDAALRDAKTKQAVSCFSRLSALTDKRVTVVVDDEDVNTLPLASQPPQGQRHRRFRGQHPQYLIDNGALVMPTAVAK
jgi:large subunit ribosomal protein L4